MARHRVKQATGDSAFGLAAAFLADEGTRFVAEIEKAESVDENARIGSCPNSGCRRTVSCRCPIQAQCKNPILRRSWIQLGDNAIAGRGSYNTPVRPAAWRWLRRHHVAGHIDADGDRGARHRTVDPSGRLSIGADQIPGNDRKNGAGAIPLWNAGCLRLCPALAFRPLWSIFKPSRMIGLRIAFQEALRR